MPKIRHGSLELETAYSMRALAREVGWDHRKLKRVLARGLVFPRADGLVWISDIRAHMAHFLDSWDERNHLRKMRMIRERTSMED